MERDKQPPSPGQKQDREQEQRKPPATGLEQERHSRRPETEPPKEKRIDEGH